MIRSFLANNHGSNVRGANNHGSNVRGELSLPDSEKFRLLLLNVDENTRSYLQLHAGDSCMDRGTCQCDQVLRKNQSFGARFFEGASTSLSAFNSAGSAGASEPRDLSNVVCWKCNRKGHYARDCKDGGCHPSSRQGTPRKVLPKKGHPVEKEKER